MPEHDDIPELRSDDSEDRPLRSRRFTVLLRTVVIVGVIGLVLPGVLSTWRVQEVTAQAACEIWVNYEIPGPSGAYARFELFGPGFIGWECYAVGSFGSDGHIASLGLIPGPPRLPAPGIVRT